MENALSNVTNLLETVLFENRVIGTNRKIIRWRKKKKIVFIENY